MKLLVDSGEFCDALATDIAEAAESVLTQVMSFEGDTAGTFLANLLIRSACSDRRLLIDCYSRHIMSCRVLRAPLAALDDSLRNEVHATEATQRGLRRAGVQVRFGSPAGRLLHRLPARNHKKSIVIDKRVAYIGGINFTDHNFAWHDLMLRIDDPAAAVFLHEDLERTWNGEPALEWRHFDELSIGTIDGRDNARGFEPVFDLIASAREDVLVQSPFLTFPFTDSLRDAARRGVRVTVMAPGPATTGTFGRYIAWESQRSRFRLRRLPGMTHMKAMLVDGRSLVLGSSNFDYLSYRRHQEIVAIVTDPQTIADFNRRVVATDLARSTCAEPLYQPGGYLRRLWMHATGEALARISLL
ncbi:MAG TPA: phosphatidylserine/phosphatidylglycerophosphate/cardiolipin synthase family protein [Longimicrobiales bacterium]|nr:phosphatidylserine/phosphatidylglycerophosphate/cardiolipin synthase family protein [Longimicrobiales bacterium]